MCCCFVVSNVVLVCFISWSGRELHECAFPLFFFFLVKVVHFVGCNLCVCVCVRACVRVCVCVCVCVLFFAEKIS